MPDSVLGAGKYSSEQNKMMILLTFKKKKENQDVSAHFVI